ERSVIFRARVEKAGTYDVRLAYTANPNRATNVPITIQTADGPRKAVLNQRNKPKTGAFQSVGQYRLERGEVAVTIGTAGTDGHVIADAVQLVPAPAAP